MIHALQAIASTFINAMHFLISSLILCATYNYNYNLILAINILITYLTMRYMRNLIIRLYYSLKKNPLSILKFFFLFFTLLMRECTKHP